MSNALENLKERTNRLLTAEQAAEILSVEPQTLACWRMTAKNLSFIKVGRSVRYRASEIEAFLERQTVSAS